jgi:hypothetical protein
MHGKMQQRGSGCTAFVDIPQQSRGLLLWQPPRLEVKQRPLLKLPREGKKLVSCSFSTHKTYVTIYLQINWIWNLWWRNLKNMEPGARSRYSDWLRAGRPRGRSSSPGRVKNFLLSTSYRMALGPIQPPIQWVPGALPLGVKRPGCEPDHSPPTSAEAKKM